MYGTKTDNRFRAVRRGLCAVVVCVGAGLINIIGIIIGDKVKLL